MHETIVLVCVSIYIFISFRFVGLGKIKKHENNNNPPQKKPKKAIKTTTIVKNTMTKMVDYKQPNK